jgi:type VI secretion system protein ImpK
MSSDNPFSEPDVSDRTVIRPRPGGRSAFPPAAPTQPILSAQPITVSEGATIPAGMDHIATGLSPLTKAAGPLLALLGSLRNLSSEPDPEELRSRAIQAMRQFEQQARAAGVPQEQLRPAHYALCASLDDVVLNSPWGSRGAWVSQSLVSTFHHEVRSGERVFGVLTQLRQHPGAYLSVLELIYMCLSLGLMGQYRLSRRGPGELDRLREELYALIMRQRRAPDPALSPHWKSLDAAYRPRRPVLPVWVAAAAGLALLGTLYLWLSTTVNTSSDLLYERMVSAPLAHMPAIQRAAQVVPPAEPPPVTPTAQDLLRTFLKPETDKGLVAIVGTPSSPIIRIRNLGLFGSGSATLESGSLPLLRRVGEALKREQGRVTVLGYTDNQPIHTVQFPSNFQLSTARAEAARAVIATAVGDEQRVSAEGRADADPIASNDTPDGRAQNRRIEIVLQQRSS